VSGACCLPHPDKVDKGGEDAHFFTNAGYGAIGVADGVGGWAEYGVDPADYSKGFMATASMAVEQGETNLVEVLRAAHVNTDIAGAATAVVLRLDPETNSIAAANLGDAGFRLVRGGRVVFASPAQSHMFDCPFQFGHPNYVEVTDYADNADIFELPAEIGDCVVMGSDGLFDNMFDKEIEDIVSSEEAPSAGASPDDIQRIATAVAQRIAKVAQAHSVDESYVSPYVVEAEAAGESYLSLFDKLRGKTMTGGKLDDITVVVGFVAAAPAPAPVEE